MPGRQRPRMRSVVGLVGRCGSSVRRAASVRLLSLYVPGAVARGTPCRKKSPTSASFLHSAQFERARPDHHGDRATRVCLYLSRPSPVRARLVRPAPKQALPGRACSYLCFSLSVVLSLPVSDNRALRVVLRFCGCSTSWIHQRTTGSFKPSETFLALMVP